MDISRLFVDSSVKEVRIAFYHIVSVAQFIIDIIWIIILK